MARGSNNIELAKEKIFGILAVVVWIFIFLRWLKSPSSSFHSIIGWIFILVIIIAICIPTWFDPDRPDVKRYKKSARKKNRRKK